MKKLINNEDIDKIMLYACLSAFIIFLPFKDEIGSVLRNIGILFDCILPRYVTEFLIPGILFLFLPITISVFVIALILILASPLILLEIIGRYLINKLNQIIK